MLLTESQITGYSFIKIIVTIYQALLTSVSGVKAKIVPDKVKQIRKTLFNTIAIGERPDPTWPK